MGTSIALATMIGRTPLSCPAKLIAADAPTKLRESYKIQSLDRAVSLLHVLCASPNPLLLTEIASKTSLHKSTTQRFLRILQGHDLVHRRTDGRYHLGLTLRDYGEKAVEQFDPRDKAAAPFRRLIYELNEAGALLSFKNEMMVCLDKASGVKASLGALQIGSSTPVQSSAAGRAVLAFSPEGVIDRICSRSSSREGLGYRSMIQRLEEIRDSGFAVDESETAKGMRTVAAPIFGRAGVPIAAISVFGPTFRMTPTKVQAFADRLTTCCKQISSDLGCKN